MDEPLNVQVARALGAAVRCFLGHDWQRWERYVQKCAVMNGGKPVAGVVRNELRQKRECKRCGFMRDEPVRVEDRLGTGLGLR